MEKLPRTIFEDLDDYSGAAVAKYKYYIFYLGAKGFWRVHCEGKTVMYCGVKEGGMLSHPEIWFMLGQSFKSSIRENLRISGLCLKMLVNLYPNLRARVATDSQIDNHFARHMGFELMSENAEYKCYKVKK